MPDGVRLAGFVPPGIEVNQVFGSLTARGPDQTWAVEVPAGLPGPYVVFLSGFADGPFVVTVTGRVRGRGVYGRKWTGTIARGQRLVGGVIQDFDPKSIAGPTRRKRSPGSPRRCARLGVRRPASCCSRPSRWPPPEAVAVYFVLAIHTPSQSLAGGSSRRSRARRR